MMFHKSITLSSSSGKAFYHHRHHKKIKRDAHFWLRAECKPLERRTILMPKHVEVLIKEGHTVTVELSSQRAVGIEKFKEVQGVNIAQEGQWVDAPSDAVILGLKELPKEPFAIKHTHVYFAHCFKNQFGHEDILRKFGEGEGKLYDLEFLEKDGRRIAAFGEAAGTAGTAVGVMSYIWNRSNPDLVINGEGLPSLSDKYFDTSKELAEYVIAEAKKNDIEMPSVHVIGALGQVGTGARKMIDLLHIPDEKITLWDMQETSAHDGPYEELLDSDIFVNCINLKQKGLVFLKKDTLLSPQRKLSVISDISCDYTNPANPIPIYSEGTSFKKPTTRLIDGPHPLDIVSIDYLPTLIPVESSELFGDKLLPHLLQFGNTPVWNDALDLFHSKLKTVQPSN